MNRTYWCIVGGIAVGALGAALVYRHRHQLKPLAAHLAAKGLALKERALDCAARAREHAEDIVAEARHINEGLREADQPA